MSAILAPAGTLQSDFSTFSSLVLRLQPNDSNAPQTKLVLLLQTEQYKSALDLAKSLQASSQGSFQILFGMAYALYRLNSETEASDVVSTITPNGDYEDRGLMHMKAQIVCSSRLSSFSHQSLFDRNIVLAIIARL